MFVIFVFLRITLRYKVTVIAIKNDKVTVIAIKKDKVTVIAIKKDKVFILQKINAHMRGKSIAGLYTY